LRDWSFNGKRAESTATDATIRPTSGMQSMLKGNWSGRKQLFYPTKRLRDTVAARTWVAATTEQLANLSLRKTPVAHVAKLPGRYGSRDILVVTQCSYRGLD
jgi:hypothetical protein